MDGSVQKRSSMGFTEFSWRFAELYIVKLGQLCQILMSFKICALNLITMVLFEVGVCLPILGPYTVYVSSLFQIVIASASLFFNSNPLEEDPMHDECKALSSRTSFTYLYSWLGTSTGSVRLNIVIICLSTTLILTQLIITIRQKRRRSSKHLESPHLLFPDADSADVLHQGFCLATKFGCNYWFYKIGLELTLSMMSLNAMLRMDLLGCIYLTMIIPCALFNRKTAKILWPFFVMTFGILMFLQYAFTVGMPERDCYTYPWDHIINIKEFNENLVDFLSLPSSGRFHRIPIFFRMSIDAITMMLMASQAYCFDCESSDHPAGDNASDEYYTLEGIVHSPPEDNYISHPKSSFDYLKIFVVTALHWIALVSFLIAGLGGRSIFNIGYLIGAFIVLWQGNSIYRVATLRRTVIQWKLMLGFNLITMFMKISIQILACGYFFEIQNNCNLRQWMNVICSSTESISRIERWRNSEGGPETCSLKNLHNELPVDVCAFILLLLNLRLLNSKIFKWRILEIYCEEIQANSGAILINQLISKEVHDQYEKQVRTLKQIAKRAAELKNNNDGGYNFKPQTYPQAIHSGDYYMFAYEPYQDDLNEDSELFIRLDGGDTPEDKAKLTPIQVIFAFLAQGLDFEETLKAIENAESIHDEELRMLEAVKKEPKENSDELLSSDSMESFRQKRRQLRDEYVSEQTTKHKKTFKEKLKWMGKFIAKLFSAIIHHLSCFLRKHSRQQRYVTFVLGKEKIKLKSRILEELREIGEITTMPCYPVIFAVNDVEQVQREAREAENLVPPFCRFLLAVYNYITANTDNLCFILATLTHTLGGGAITMPLPIMVFFWGVLSNPRPEKTFWICMMIYTQLIIVIKCCAQIAEFNLFSFNLFDRQFTEDDVRSYLGLQNEKSFAMCDMALLLFLFFHRYMLQRLGLWKNSLSKIVNRSESMEDEEYNCCIQFFQNVINPKKRFIGDMYSVCFLLDLLCVSIVLFGYSSFADTSTDGIPLFHTSRIPLSLVITIIAFIFLIIIDRALYLRKLVLLKLIYHMIVVVALHVWIFFVIPYTSRTSLPKNILAQVFYMAKCINLLLSGWQIRNGYPPLCTGGLLTQNFGLISSVLYKGFMNLPFAFELRSAIDWTWTDTAMSLFDFIKFEIFFSNVYMVKCARQMEQNFPTPRGQKKAMTAKHTLGVPVIFLLVIVILSPILVFSLLNSIGQSYAPLKMKIELSFETLPPFYESVIEKFEHILVEDRITLTQSYVLLENDKHYDGKKARLALTFLNEFYDQDIYKISFNEFSVSPWNVSPGALRVLYQDLLLGNRSEMNVKMVLERGSYKDSDIAIKTHVIEYKISLEGEVLSSLTALVNKTFIPNVNVEENMMIPFAIPYYILLPSTDKIEVADSMLKVVSNATDSKNKFQDTFGRLNLTLSGGIEQGGFYWKLQVFRADSISHVTLPEPDCDMIIFMDRMFPTWLLHFSSASIIPMYLAVVVVAFKFVRAFIFADPLRAIIKEMPNPDPVLKILLDVYLVREAQDFLLEEELFAKIIFLFRSPGTLIKWTRFKIKKE
ncbi:unnamed protein product [Bursaphelenchus xylophilus]|uniref:(pine wood nematode) hypothetical protein n=1 Tax=Bursaphelenchus xylophilus TaxID=6326 RepID=A0A1I7RH48_BURXY|nr:unnamed protein product [Bursaphelenchus xylophilus]CAG9115978.1 unnamed protein product [Bursaphelenchus xylophilus]